MTKSDLLSRMYQLPSSVLNQEQLMLMQKLHSMQGSPVTDTSARKGRSSSASAQTSASWLDPYIRRIYFLLRAPDGRWFADVQGATVIWSDSPDDAQVYNHERTARQAERQLRDQGLVQRDELMLMQVPFYAHKARAHLWSAAYV